MRLYTAFDFHPSNSYWAIIDEAVKRVMNKKLRNNPEIIINVLRSFKDDIERIAVESTYK